MLSYNSLVLLMLALLAPAQAESSIGSLPELPSNVPICATGCLDEVVFPSACGGWDISCVRGNETLSIELEKCMKIHCSVKDALAIQNLTKTLAGDTVRDDVKSALLPPLILGSLAIVFVALRICARLPALGGNWGYDDWAILAAMVPTLPLTFFAIPLAHAGLGKDMWTLSPPNITLLLKYYYIDESLYLAALALTKISILLFYLRIFPSRRWRRFTYGTIAACVLYMLAFLPAIIFQCTPIDLAWERWDGEHDGSCVNLNVLANFAAAYNIALDLCVIGLPVWPLWQLQMVWQKKLIVMGMFAGGALVTVLSLVRLASSIRFAKTENPSWDYTGIGYLSTLEVHLGIIFACLPALRSLLPRCFPGVKIPSRFHPGPYGAYGTTQKGSANRKSDNGTTSSQSNGMQGGAEKDFMPLANYEARVGFDPEKSETGRTVDETRNERHSTNNVGDQVADMTSINRGQAVGAPTWPSNSILVTREFDVEWERLTDPDLQGQGR